MANMLLKYVLVSLRNYIVGVYGYMGAYVWPGIYGYPGAHG